MQLCNPAVVAALLHDAGCDVSGPALAFAFSCLRLVGRPSNFVSRNKISLMWPDRFVVLAFALLSCATSMDLTLILVLPCCDVRAPDSNRL